MSEIILHLGLMKTGTTFIQRQIFEKAENVNLLQRIIYPEIKVTKKYLMHLKKQLVKNKINIISNETFGGVPCIPSGDMNHYYDNQVRYELVDMFCDIFSNAKILIGIREQDAWVCSHYNMYVRRGGTSCFKKWYKYVFNKEHLDFKTYINYLYNKFNNVHQYHYEILQIFPDMFVKDICKFIGVDVPSYAKIVYKKSYTKNQVWLLRNLNKVFKTDLNKKGFKQNRFLNPKLIVSKVL